MAEPNSTSTSIVAIAIASLGPVAGQYSLIVMAALAGAMWPLSTMPHTTKLQGGLFLARIVITAVVCTGSGAWFLADHFHLPVYESLSLAAFGIGAMGNRWTKVFRALIDGISGIVRGMGGNK